MKNVFIIGSKGIPAKYGGYETFVDNLILKRKSKDIKYHVACLSNRNSAFEYNGADCFNIKVPNIGHAKAIYYDIKALKYCVKYIKCNQIKNCIIYVLTCRIGPFFNKYVKQIHKLGSKVYLNPDGHEWMRAKWSKPVRKYWKISEKIMVRFSDLIICDSKAIEEYIKKTYKKYNPLTKYIAYGAEVKKSSLDDNDPILKSWQKTYNINAGEYYLIVGRFVPENNLDLMIREFRMSNTEKKLVIVTNVEKNEFYKKLQSKYDFENDPRIHFVGTIYDKQFLKKIREQAFAYLHGHSVGGTNPSLLEALSSTNVNLLYDVSFNKECGADSAFYFSSALGELAKLIDRIDLLSKKEQYLFGFKSTHEIIERYSWNFIIDEYEKVFNQRNY